MRKPPQYPDDEHMQYYEWCGAGSATICDLPAQSRLTTARRTACGVLTLIGGLLVLAGCANRDPAEQANVQPVEEPTQMKAGSLYEEDTSKPASLQSPEAAGHALGESLAEQPAG